MSLANQRSRTSTPSLKANTTHGRVVLENNSEALWGCADRILSLNSRGVVCFACLSGLGLLGRGQFQSCSCRYVFCLPVPFAVAVTTGKLQLQNCVAAKRTFAGKNLLL